MSPAAMVSPEAARSEARRRLVASHRRWTLDGWSPPVWTLPLRPPTERQVLADPAAAAAWVRGWAGRTLPTGISVDWEDRTWRSVGTQRVPVRIVAQSPEDLAGFVGGPEARDWRAIAERVGRIRELGSVRRPSGLPAGEAPSGDHPDPLSAALRRNAHRLTTLPDAEFSRLLEVTAWLGSRPVTGLRPRQLPIRGVDSKWFSTHRTVLAALHAALFGGAVGASGDGPSGGEGPGGGDDRAGGDGAGVGLGILEADPRVRLRALDPDLRLAGLSDLQVPVAEAAGIGWRPELVLIVENQETLLSLPPVRGTVAVWGRGFDTAATTQPWLCEKPILYWGDLDSHGFAILNRYRTHLPQIESVLMDEATLEYHADLWVPEPKPFRGTLPALTPAEARTLARLRDEGDVRLEQERIPWSHVLAVLDSQPRIKSLG